MLSHQNLLDLDLKTAHFLTSCWILLHLSQLDWDQSHFSLSLDPSYFFLNSDLSCPYQFDLIHRRLISILLKIQIRSISSDQDRQRKDFQTCWDHRRKHFQIYYGLPKIWSLKLPFEIYFCALSNSINFIHQRLDHYRQRNHLWDFHQLSLDLVRYCCLSCLDLGQINWILLALMKVWMMVLKCCHHSFHLVHLHFRPIEPVNQDHHS